MDFIEELKVLKSNDCELIYNYALKHPNVNTKKFQDAFLKTYSSQIKNKKLSIKNWKYLVLFAQNINGIDLKPFEQKALRKKNPYQLYSFVKNVKGANVKDFEKAILKTDSNPEILYKFAKTVKGADTIAFKDKMIEYYTNFGFNEHFKYFIWFADDIKLPEISEFEKLILNHKSTNLNKVLCFMENVKNANIEKFEEAIIKNKNGILNNANPEDLVNYVLDNKCQRHIDFINIIADFEKKSEKIDSYTKGYSVLDTLMLLKNKNPKLFKSLNFSEINYLQDSKTYKKSIIKDFISEQLYQLNKSDNTNEKGKSM